MARRDALLRLHKSLVNRRGELLRRLGGELQDLRDSAGGDSADWAFDAGSDDVSSQLAELESRELVKIERALQRLKNGLYGVCEGCQKKIPVARLNALPFSATCVQCQREMELHGSYGAGGMNDDWGKVSEGSFDDQREIRLSDLEMDFSSR